MEGTFPRHRFPPFYSQIANPAAGNFFDIVPPGGQAWRVLGFRFELITDATVANRQVRVTMYNGILPFDFICSTAIQAASTAMIYCFTGHMRGVSQSAGLTNFSGWDPETIITVDVYIDVTVDGMQAGDQLQTIWVRHERFIGE